MQAQTTSAFNDCFSGGQELVETTPLLQKESEALEVIALYKLKKQWI